MSAKNAGISKGDPVLVSVQSRTGDKTLQRGEVKELAGKGAFVQIDRGPRRFFFVSQITKDTTPPPAPPAPSAAPAPKQSAPAHFTPKPAPEPTIGALFAAERVSRGLTQGVAARELGVKLAELIDFESGADLPNDEIVLRFSEAFSVELGPLSDALGRALPVPKPAAAAPAPTSPEKSEAVAVPTPPAKSEPEAGLSPITAEDLDRHLRLVEQQRQNGLAVPPVPSAPVASATFEDFVERLDEVTPLPARGAQRQQWFALAKALFKLNTETASA